MNMQVFNFKPFNRSHKPFSTLVMLLFALFFSACSSDKPASEATPPQSLYAQAKAEYDVANYAAAINDFIGVLNNNPDLTTQELAQYYLSLSYYYSLNYAQAESELNTFINSFADTVTYYDAAHYWRGRAKQKQGKYDEAILDYQYVIGRNASVYVDNAQFQIGNAHYEQAVALMTAVPSDLATAYAKLSLASGEFSTFVINNPTSTYIDDAAYFAGRTFHRMAEVLQQNAAIDTGNTEAGRYGEARTAYAAFETDPNLSASVYADSALYFSGRTYQAQTLFDFSAARTQFQKLLDNAAFVTSTWRDDAQYQIAITYYDTAVPLVASDEVTAATNFESAISEFNQLLLSPANGQSFADNNRWDNSLYYRGRAFERLTLMIDKSQQPDVLLGSASLPALTSVFLGNATPPTLIDMYTVSRAAFQALLSFDTTSSYADDAQLEIGVLYQNQAGNATITTSDADIFNLLAQAEDANIAVTTLGNCVPDSTVCSSADNALYNKASVYSDVLAITLGTAITPVDPFNQAVTYDLARTTYSQLITSFATSSWVDNAYYHMADLSRKEGEIPGNINTAKLERALDDYAQVILYDPAGQYVDNSIYYIGFLYHEYSPATVPDPNNAGQNIVSDGCTLAFNWFSVYVGLSNSSNYSFSYNSTGPVAINSAALALSATKLGSAQTYVDNYNAGNYDCADLLSGQSLLTIVNAPQ